MRKQLKLYFFIGLIILKQVSFASTIADSLYKLLKVKQADTVLIDIYNDLCWPVYTSGNSDSAIKYGNKALALSTKINDLNRLATACRRLGIAYINMGNYQKALFYQTKSYDLCEKTGNKKGMASALNNIGVVYLNASDFKKALDYSLRSQKIQEEIKDSSLLFESYYNTGLLFKENNNFNKANIYYTKAYRIASVQKNNTNMGFALNGIANIIKNNGKYDSAQKCFEEALIYFKKENNYLGLTESLTNLGSMFMDRKDLEFKTRAKIGLSYFHKAQAYYKEHKNKFYAGSIAGNIADAYSLLAQPDSVIFYAKKAVEYSTSSNNQAELVFVYKHLAQAYENKGDYKQSLYYLNKHLKLKEIIYNETKQKELLEKQMQFDFDKKILADSLNQVQEKKEAKAKMQLANSKLKQEKIVRYSLIAGIILIALFLFIIFRRFKETKKQNIIIEQQNQQVTLQKNIIEEKQKEIVSSINYAKRIQKTLLVKDNELRQNLKDYFILFRPKDIVSGDFYWTAKKDNLFFIACCDCTGHGVPGAFMSLLNIGFLNEAVNEKNILEPHKIFDHVRKRLIESISHDGGQDGMDGILLCFDDNSNTITYAAANNAPVVIKNKSLVHLKADKMPVGMGIRTENFSLGSFEKNNVSDIFIYTDGYADQFGGPKGKKYKYKQFNELLLSLSSLPASEQTELLNKQFDDWKGPLEQVDDVCVIGIRI